MKIIPTITILSMLLLASCASNSGDKKSVSMDKSVHKTLSQRLDANNGYKQDTNGNWVPQSDRRSSFEGKHQSSYMKGDYQKKAYQAGDYSTKSWWGNKQHDTHTYTGNTDASRFQKSSAMQGRGANEANANAEISNTYQTGSYTTTNAANDSGHASIATAPNTAIDNRRKTFPHPDVIGWKEQRNLSMDQSKSFLGN